MGKRSTTEHSLRKRGRGRPPGHAASRNKARLGKVTAREKVRRKAEKCKAEKSPKTVTESKNVSARIVMEGAEEYMQPTYQEGDVVLDVECGPNKAQMYLSKLCQGSKGPCIFFQGSWLTPNEFQYVSGRETAKDWKRSIRHQGKSMKLLLSKGVLSVHSTMCECESCRVSVPVNRCRLADKKQSTTTERRGRRLTTMVSLEFPREEVTESQESGSDADEVCPTDAVPSPTGEVTSQTDEDALPTDDKELSDSDTIPGSPPKLTEKHCSPLRESRLNNIIDQLRITKEKQGVPDKGDPQISEDNAESPNENKAPANIHMLTDDDNDKYGGETEEEMSDEEVRGCGHDSGEVSADESRKCKKEVPQEDELVAEQTHKNSFQVKEAESSAKCSPDTLNKEQGTEKNRADVYTFDECDTESEKKVPPLVISIPKKLSKRQREGKAVKVLDKVVKRKEQKPVTSLSRPVCLQDKKERSRASDKLKVEEIKTDLNTELIKLNDTIETNQEVTEKQEVLVMDEIVDTIQDKEESNAIETIQIQEELTLKPQNLDTNPDTSEHEKEDPIATSEDPIATSEDPIATSESVSEVVQVLAQSEENITTTEIETATNLIENDPPRARAVSNVHSDSDSVVVQVNQQSDCVCAREQPEVKPELMNMQSEDSKDTDVKSMLEDAVEVKVEEKTRETTPKITETAKRMSPMVTPKRESPDSVKDNKKTDSKAEESIGRKTASDGKYSDYMRLLAATHAQPALPFLPPGIDPFFALRGPDGPLAPGLFNPYHMLLGHPGLLPKDSAYLPTSPASSGINPPCVSPLLMAPRLPFGLPPPMFDLSRPVPFLPVSDSMPYTCPTMTSGKRGPPEGDTALDLSTKHMKFSYHNNILNANKLRNSERHSKQNFAYSHKEHRSKRQHHNDSIRKSQGDIKYSPTTAKHLQSWIDQASKRAQSTCRCAANNPNDIRNWPVDKVVHFLTEVDGCSVYSENFREQRVDGKTLPFLTTDHLMRNLGMKLGPALALSEAVAEKVREISKSNWSCDHCRKRPSVYVEM